jgi:hypothetical protein
MNARILVESRPPLKKTKDIGYNIDRTLAAMTSWMTAPLIQTSFHLTGQISVMHQTDRP